VGGELAAKRVMHPEFARYVEMAADVATSGRWNEVNGVIERLCANPGSCEAWQLQVLTSLCSKVFREYLNLKRDYEVGQDPPLLAWRARNLLELSVWAIYCSKDINNAREFYSDWGSDGIGILEAFANWGRQTGKDSTWLDRLEQTKQSLSVRAAGKGITPPTAKFTRVAAAAKTSVLAPPDDAYNSIQRDLFFGQGCLYFIGAFEPLERALKAAINVP
jgi:hypothetical protein